MRAPVTFAVGSMLAVLAMTSMAMVSVAVVAPEAAPDIGVDATYIGAFTSIAYASAMLSGLVTGTLVARYGAIRVCQATLVSAAVGLAALALATPAAAVLAALFIGVAYGPGNPASAHLLTGIAPPRWRPLIFSIRQTGVTLGGAVTGAVVPYLAVRFGWQVAVFAVGGLGLVLLAAMQPLRRTFDAGRRTDVSLAGISLVAPLRHVFGNPALRRHAAAGFCFAGCQVCVAAFFVVYLTDALAMPLVEAGFVYATTQVGGIVGRILWGATAESLFPSRRVLGGLGLAIAVCLATIAAAAGSWPLPVMLGLGLAIGLTSFGWNGVYLSEIANLVPDGAVGEATGGVQFIMFGGVVAVPPGFGALVAATGSYTLAFSAASALALGTGLFLLFSPRPSAPSAPW